MAAAKFVISASVLGRVHEAAAQEWQGGVVALKHRSDEAVELVGAEVAAGHDVSHSVWGLSLLYRRRQHPALRAEPVPLLIFRAPRDDDHVDPAAEGAGAALRAWDHALESLLRKPR